MKSAPIAIAVLVLAWGLALEPAAQAQKHPSADPRIEAARKEAEALRVAVGSPGLVARGSAIR